MPVRKRPGYPALRSCSAKGVHAYPRGEGFFGDFAGGNLQHGDHAVDVGRIEVKAIERQKQLGGDETGALVAVDKCVISADAVAVRSRKIARIRRAVEGEILCTRERGGQHACVAGAREATVFGKLGVINRFDNRRFNPDPVSVNATHGRLLREFGQYVAALFHDATCGIHLRLKFGVGGGDAHAVGSGTQEKAVALVDVQLRQDFLRQKRRPQSYRFE